MNLRCTEFRNFLASNRTTVWTGYGASYALAATISMTLHRMGFDAKVCRPSELPPGNNTVLVSQSCNAAGNAFGFSIAGTSAVEKVKWPCLLVNDSDIGQEWFPIKFQARVLTEVSRMLQLPYTPVRVPGNPAKPLYLILDDCADLLQLLVISACHKCSDLRLAAVPIDDFAHGAHVSTLRSGAVCVLASRLTHRHNSIASWLREHHRPVHIVELNSESPASWPLLLHATVLNVVAAHAGARGVNLSQRRISPADDTLRDILSGDDRELQ